MAMTEAELKAAEEQHQANVAKFEADKTASGASERFKDDPAYKAMSKQIADDRKANEDRRAADDAAKAEAKKAADAAAITKAEEEKDFVTAQKLRDDAHKAELDKLKSDTAKANLRSELAVVGFEKRGIDLLASEYDSETHGTIQEYSKAVFENEANKGFLAGSEGRTVHKPGGKLPAGGPNQALRGDALRAAATSDDPKIRLQAVEIKKAHYEQHGNFDKLYD